MKPNMPMLKRLVNFVLERQRIYVKRQQGEPAPWTKDPILQRYRFCNVYREQDRVTVWIDQHIRRPYANHPHLWFMLCIARQINWPPTLQALIDAPNHAWPHALNKWDAWSALHVLRSRSAMHDKVYTGAYMISGNPGRLPRKLAKDKPAITCLAVLQPLWEDHVMFETAGLESQGRALRQVYDALRDYHGWGDFLAAQVVADLKYTRYLPWKSTPDWFDWAVLGPGSTRGLNRVFPAHARKVDRRSPLKAPWEYAEAHRALLIVREWLQHALRTAKLNAKLPMCLQDTQNCLCEFDKYERTRLGQGRPRATFDGG